MEKIIPKYSKQIFVCVMKKEHPKESCAPKNSLEIFKKLRAFADNNKLNVRVSKSYCQGLCSNGPIVSVFPDNIYYKKVRLEDVDEIIEKHLKH